MLYPYPYSTRYCRVLLCSYFWSSTSQGEQSSLKPPSFLGSHLTMPTNADEGFTSTPSPVVQSTVSLLCWSMALVGTFLAPREPGGGGGGSDALDNSFRARFLLPLLPASVLLWTFIYVALCNCLKKNCRPASLKSVGGYPGWSYMVGVCHGLVFLPVMFALAVAAHLYESGVSLDEFASFGLEASPFWQAGWGSATMASQHLLEQVHCAVIGYMLKDFAVYPGGLETGYILHHIFAVLGCTLCLWFPSAVGVITFQAAQCEFASALFSAQTLYPTRLGKVLYFTSMPGSNVLAAWLSWLVVVTWASHAAFPQRALYGALTVFLLIIRSVGVVLEGMSACGNGDSGGGNDGVNEQRTQKKKKMKDD